MTDCAQDGSRIDQEKLAEWYGDLPERLGRGCQFVYRWEGGLELGQVDQVAGEFIQLAHSEYWIRMDQVLTESVVGDE